jgi:hypothetical protein
MNVVAAFFLQAPHQTICSASIAFSFHKKIQK